MLEIIAQNDKYLVMADFSAGPVTVVLSLDKEMGVTILLEDGRGDDLIALLVEECAAMRRVGVRRSSGTVLEEG